MINSVSLVIKYSLITEMLCDTQFQCCTAILFLCNIFSKNRIFLILIFAFLECFAVLFLLYFLACHVLNVNLEHLSGLTRCLNFIENHIFPRVIFHRKVF